MLQKLIFYMCSLDLLQETADLVTFTEEILNEKYIFFVRWVAKQKRSLFYNWLTSTCQKNFLNQTKN